MCFKFQQYQQLAPRNQSWCGDQLSLSKHNIRKKFQKLSPLPSLLSVTYAQSSTLHTVLSTPQNLSSFKRLRTNCKLMIFYTCDGRWTFFAPYRVAHKYRTSLVAVSILDFSTFSFFNLKKYFISFILTYFGPFQSNFERPMAENAKNCES